MKYRQKVISDYKLLTPEKFLEHYSKITINRIPVRFAIEYPLSPAADHFNELITSTEVLVNTDMADEANFAPAWVAIIFGYLEHTNPNKEEINRDRYIWID